MSKMKMGNRVGSGISLSAILAAMLAIGNLFMISDARAAQTSVPFFECRNCSDAQMQQAALARPGYGVRIVYNLASGHIFKYNVYLEPGCLNRPEEARRDSAGTASSCNQNPSRQIEWMPIDTDMLGPFAAMVEVYNAAPQMLATAKASIEIEAVGYMPGSLLDHFDPRLVAYDRNSGTTFNLFMEAANNFFDTHASVFAVNRNLATWVWDVLGPLRTMQINISGQPGMMLDMSSVLMQTVTVDFYDETGAFVRVRYQRIPGTSTYEAEFITAQDSAGATLPTYEEVATPGFNRRYPGRNYEAANLLGRFLNRQGWGLTGTNPGCRQYELSCIVQPAEHRMCRIDCIP